MGDDPVIGDALEELRRGHGLRWWVRRAAIYGLIGPYTRRVNPPGIDVPGADWDTLVVLDACREDLFREVVGIERFDEYRTVPSRGSATVEWTKANWAGRDWPAVVYVTANPYISKLTPDAFHEIRPVWETAFSTDHGTVLPGEVTDSAIEAAEQFPHKRLVVHYMQPHHPFLVDGWGDEYFHNPEAPDPWERLEEGDRSRREVWDAYRDTLERTWPEVTRLLETLEGRTVLTSDHGNLLGERLDPFPVRGFGHSIGLHVPELVEVPWAVEETGDRREVQDGAATERPVDRNLVEDRLEHLGYR
jgi:arylsulfatase A-like enzyme